MLFLLDTHTLIWFLEGSEELSEKAKIAITNPVNSKWVSVASIWEISIKASLGKLTLKKPFYSIDEQIVMSGFGVLPIAFSHTYKLTRLPFHHRDPFDRLLIAQARTEGMTLITRDGHFDRYEVPLCW